MSKFYMYVDGYRVLEPPELTTHKKQIKSIAMSALEPDVRELMNTPSKVLSERQKEIKHHYRKHIAYIVNRYSRALRKSLLTSIRAKRRGYKFFGE